MQAQNPVVHGVGETDFSRYSGRSVTRLALDATLAACRDAEIEPRNIDGMLTSAHSVTPEEMVSCLGLRDLRYSAEIGLGGAGAVASLGHAATAVNAGVATNVLIVRAGNGASGLRQKDRPSHLPSQHFRRQLEHPYGWNVPAQRYAMICRRYMHEFGLTRQALGAVALSARRHAQLNPHAQMYGRELTRDQYLTGRMVADPYTLFDCSLETDGACAVLVTRAEAACRRGNHAAIVSVTEGRPESPDDLGGRSDLLAIGLQKAAKRAWERASLGPNDMSGAMVYDCFTFEMLHQLEAAGFVPEGEAGAFVEAGNIDLGGTLPVNTHGGLLSEGHMHGLNHVVEAVRQLRGECGGRQIEGATHLAVTGWGDLGDGSLAVLRRERT